MYMKITKGTYTSIKKYFFFDIEGTLPVGTTKVIPKDTMFCLHQLKQAGHFATIATGRL
jgi:peptidyl-prolyl cis-trans isomerase B (cyclophilin B)